MIKFTVKDFGKTEISNITVTGFENLAINSVIIRAQIVLA